MYEDEDITKKCGKCKDELPLDLFYKHKSVKYGRSWLCKQCFRELRNAFGSDVNQSQAQKMALDARKRQRYDSDVIEIMEGNDKQRMTEQDAYNLLDEAVR